MVKIYAVSNYTADQVWAAIATAHRINGGYIKFDIMANTETGEPAKRPNKTLVWDILEDANAVTATDAELGQKVRKHFQGKAMELLSGPKNDFLFSAVKIAQREEFTSKDRLDVAIASCLPASYERDLTREASLDKALNSQHVGKVKDRVRGAFEIVSCNFSQKYNCYCVSAVSDGNAYFFFTQHKLEVGKTSELKGTVKAHRDNGVTQLTRVQAVA